MKAALSLAVAVVLVSVATLSPAKAGEFKKKHPRRAEVNQRERNQQKRIAEGLESGKMTAGQAAKVEKQEAAIKQQERADVKANGGYLTTGQKKQLNQELNQTSKEIYQDKHQ